MGRRAELLDASEVNQEPGGVERQWILAGAAALYFLVFFIFAGHSWAAALYRLLSDGLLLALWLAAAGGVGYWCMKRLRLTGVASAIALGIGAYSLAILLFGLVGGLNRVTAWVLLVAGVGAGASAVRRSEFSTGQIGRKLRESVPATDWLWLLVVPFCGIATIAAFMPPGFLWGGEEPNGYDVVEYHLQVPREWFEIGRIVPLKHNVFSYFPFNVELHYLFAMHLRGGPWAGMYLAQLMHLAFVVLSMFAVYEFVGRRGLLGVLIAAATPWLTMLGSIAYNEGGVLLFGTLAIGWTLRALEDHAEGVRAMALAGIFAGLACGTKLTAIPMLLLFLPAVYLLAAAFNRNFRGAVRPALTFFVAGLVVFSPWLLRNLIWAKNPVFPEAMSIFGHAHFTADQVTRWRLAYVPPPGQSDLGHRLAALKDQIFGDWRFGYALFPAAGIVLAGVIRRRKTLDAPVILLVTLIAGWLIFWLGFTHLQGRFFVLGIPVAAMLIARVDRPIGRLVVTCAVLLQVGFALLNLSGPISKQIDPLLEAGALGIEDYRGLADRYQKAADATGDVCLIGDAKAFLYQTKPGKLHYRTVFDVDATGRDVIDAWAQGWPQKSGDVVTVDPDELARFHRTYFGIPPLPGEPPTTSPASGKP